MTITAYNFSFYDYKMPTLQHHQHDDDDVDDHHDDHHRQLEQRQEQLMDVEQLNDEWPTADSSNTSAYYAVAVANDNKADAHLSSDTLQTLARVPKNTQKATAAAETEIESEQQLKPKLKATPKRWSCELREKVLAQAKRSSGSDEDNNESSSRKANSQLDHQITEQQPQLKPKLNATPKRWSCELREMVLAQAKRKNGSNEQICNGNVAYHATPNTEQNKANESVSNTVAITSDDTQTAMFSETMEHMEQISPVTVQAKISFFNKLAPSFEPKTYVNNRFLALLKKANNATAPTATIAPKATASANANELKTEKSTKKRWSTNLEDLVNPFLGKTQHQNNAASNAVVNNSPIQSFGTLASGTPLELNSDISKNPAYSVWREPRQYSKSNTNTGTGNNIAHGLQRKNSIRRKPSSEKLRGTASRSSSSSSSTSTNIQMHSLMEDLTLVMPVRLRIAEYERKIAMQC